MQRHRKFIQKNRPVSSGKNSVRPLIYCKAKLWVACNNQDRIWLDSAIEDIEGVYNRVTEFERLADEVDAVIKRIAS